MSAYLVWTLAALMASLPPLLLAGLRDPKRLRVSGGDRSAALSPPARSLLAVLGLAPGVALMLDGNWLGFMIWTGALPCLGWLWVLAMSTASRRLPES